MTCQQTCPKWTALKGVLHLLPKIPTQKLACFVLYLKLINTFLKSNIYNL